MSDGLRRKVPGLLLALIVLLYVSLGTSWVLAERPNQDEGWYLYAAKLVRQGQRPYVDFAYVQPPLLPYVYGWLGGWHSLQAGRTVSLLCGAGVVLLLGLGGARAGRVGMLLAPALLAFCAFALSQQSIVKAYALANLCLAAGGALAVWARERPGWLAGAGACFALAALARNSAAPALVGLVVWLAWRRETRRALGPVIGTALAVLAVGLGPFVLASPGEVRHNLLQHHAANLPSFDPFRLFVTAMVVAQLMIRACQPLAIALLAGLGALAAQTRRATGGVAGHAPVDASLADGLWPEVILLLLVAGLLFGGHFVSGHPYQEYQVLALPAACLAAGLLWGELDRRGEGRGLVRWGAGALGLVGLLSLGPSQADLMGNQPGPDGRRAAAGVHAPLREVARLVQEYCPPEAKLLTFQTDIAIESGRTLCDGLTLASFSFSGDPDAPAHHLVNAASLTATLAAAEPAVVVVSPGDLGALLHGVPAPGGGFVVDPALAPAMRAVYGPLIAALDRHYVEVGQVERVGQFAETMRVLARRPR